MVDYDLMAENFDTEERKARSRAFADEIRKHITDGKSKSAIEFGCGTGLVGLELIDSFDSLTFIDSTPSMIKQLEHKLLTLGKDTTQVLCCDVLEETPENLSADCIFSSLVLHHIIETESALECLYNLLNKDGRLLIIELDADDGSFHAKHDNYDGHNGFEHSVLSDLAAKVGFRQVTTKTFYHGVNIVNGKEAPYSFFIMDALK